MKFSRTILGCGFMVMAATFGSPAVAQDTARPKVAIYNLQDPAGSNLTEELVSMIETAIIGTNRFDVISRDFESAEAERQALQTGRTTRGASNQQAQFDAIDYSIEGTITAMQVGQVGNSTGRTVACILSPSACNVVQTCSRQNVSLSIDVAIVQLGTGQTPYAGQITESAESECRTGEGGQINAPAVLRAIANRLAAGFTLSIYPARVLRVDTDGTVVINYGETVFPVGARLVVFGPPSEVTMDGVTSTIPGERLANLEVATANAQIARATVDRPRGRRDAAVTIPVGAVVEFAPEQADNRRR